jgi:hypothetical protein
VAVRRSQRAACDIQRISLESEHPEHFSIRLTCLCAVIARLDRLDCPVKPGNDTWRVGVAVTVSRTDWQ